MEHLDLADICNKIRDLPTRQPSKVAFSNIGHKENPEDGFDENILKLDIRVSGALVGVYTINTEEKQRNVQNLSFGDDLCFRDVRNGNHLYFNCGWRILKNICVRESTPQRRGKHVLIVALPVPIQRIDRQQDLYGSFTHNTVLAVRYNKKETKQGRCVYSLTHSS